MFSFVGIGGAALPIKRACPLVYIFINLYVYM